MLLMGSRKDLHLSVPLVLAGWSHSAKIKKCNLETFLQRLKSMFKKTFVKLLLSEEFFSKKMLIIHYSLE